jgi:hypothetical protein
MMLEKLPNSKGDPINRLQSHYVFCCLQQTLLSLRTAYGTINHIFFYMIRFCRNRFARFSNISDFMFYILAIRSSESRARS